VDGKIRPIENKPSHLGGYGFLVHKPLRILRKGSFATSLKIGASVGFWKSMLATERELAVRAITYDGCRSFVAPFTRAFLFPTSTKAKDKVKGGFLLNVVIGKGPSILKLLSGEDKALLIGGDSFLVLNLGLDIVDGIRGLNLEGDGLSSKGLHENLHG